MTIQDNLINMHKFPNTGFLTYKLTEEDLKPIKDEINEIQSNFSNAIPFNHNLAGNLQKEFLLITSKDYTEQLLSKYIFAHNNYFDFLRDFSYLSEDKKLILDILWVNFQKKYEFNPNHNHSGVYSFVIWIDIPYEIEDEINMPASINSTSKNPGHFNFVYSNCIGNICTYSIPVDKTYNNTLCLFPAKMIHSVNPFYTSDNYRITVSGNFNFDVKR